MSFLSTIFGGKVEAPKAKPPPPRPKDDTGKNLINKGDSGMHHTMCTDFPCLVVFFAFLTGMGFIIVYAVKNGDPRKLTHGFDWQGQLCGVDPAVADSPFLFWCGGNGPVVEGIPSTLNFKSPVCVAECPTGGGDGYSALGAFIKSRRLTERRRLSAMPVPDEQVKDDSDWTGIVYCPENSNTSTQIFGEAPAVTKVVTIEQEVRPQPTYASRKIVDRYCVPDVDLSSPLMQTTLNSTAMADGKTQFLELLGSCRRAWKVIIASVVVAIILCFAYLMFLDLFAMILVYVALFLLTAVLFLCSAALLCTSLNLTGTQELSPLFQRFDHGTAVLYSQIAAGIFGALFLVFFILISCCHEMIHTAVGCVEAACKCMFSELDLLVQPCIDVVMRLGCFFSLLYGFMWLLSVGSAEPVSDVSIGGTQITGVARKLQYSDEEQYMIAFYIFGYFWIMEMCNAVSQFVISYTVVLWYYTEKDEKTQHKKMIPCALARGYGASVVHMGSLAFGSFLIAVCRFVRLILSVVAKHAEAQGNATLACVAKCLVCCVDCFKRFLEMINKNAYVDIAINSTSFCVAATHSLKFLAENGASVALLHGACFVFVWAGVGIVSVTTGLLAYYVTGNYAEYTDTSSPAYVAEPGAVGVCCCLLALCISHCFMNLFDITSETLLYCFIWNKKNDPQGVHFYAPDTLSKICGDAKDGHGGV